MPKMNTFIKRNYFLFLLIIIFGAGCNNGSKNIPQDIGRVVLNLLTNAFYAVNERLRQAQPDKANDGQPDKADVTLSLSKG